MRIIRIVLQAWVLFAIFPTLTLLAQDPIHAGAFKSSLEISYTTLRFLPREQYIGAGIGYRFMPKPWIGVQVQFSKFPQLQALEDDSSGGAILQETGSVLVGHRWGKVTLLGECGGGVLRTNVFRGFSVQQLKELYDVRYYPDVLTGGLLDVNVGRRFSLTFEVRDNLTIIGPYTGVGFYGPTQALEGDVNAPEGRAGVDFHF